MAHARLQRSGSFNARTNQDKLKLKSCARFRMGIPSLAVTFLSILQFRKRQTGTAEGGCATLFWIRDAHLLRLAPGHQVEALRRAKQETR